MQTTTEHTTTKRHLEPHVVRDHLSKRVGKILEDSLHYFEDVEEEMEERYFDVDGILAGRPSREQRASNRRSTPQSRMPIQPRMQSPENAHILTLPTRGSFIPTSHFKHLFGIS